MSSPRLILALLVTTAFSFGALGPASAGTAKYGGVLTVGLTSGDPGSLDPTLANAASQLIIWHTICEKLYDFDAKAQVVPQLAAALPVISKDKLSYTIKLRRGIVLNDGTPFNARAVVISLQRHMTLPGSAWASDLAPVASIIA